MARIRLGHNVAIALCALAAHSSSLAVSSDDEIQIGPNHYLVKSVLRRIDIFSGGEIVRYNVRYVIPAGTYVGQGTPQDLRRIVDADCQRGLRRELIRLTDAEEWKSVYERTAYATEVSTACSIAGLSIPFRRQSDAVTVQTPPSAAPPPSAPVRRPIPERPAEPGFAFGSGFVVATGYVVTNAHVVEGCRTLSVKQGPDLLGATLDAKAQGVDLALLKTDRGIGAPSSVRQSAVLGEDVMVAGHPLVGLLSADIVVTSGQVNSLSGLVNDPMMFQLSAGVHSGNSGGPVLDRTGAVVGVVVSKLDALKLGRVTGELTQNVNFAIKPEVLRLFLDSNRVRYQSSTVGRKLDGAELAEKARQTTVQIVCAK